MPQPFKNAVITNGGADLLTRAQAGQTKILFTRIAVGNGIYTDEEKELVFQQRAEALREEKNSYPLSSIEVQTDHSVKVTVLITNMDPQTRENLVDTGYYINEIGLFAKLSDEDDEQEVLYSIALTAGEQGDFMPPYNGLFPSRITQGWIIAVDNAENVTVEYKDDTYALAKDLKSKGDEIDIDEETGEVILKGGGKELSRAKIPGSSGSGSGGETTSIIFATRDEVKAVIDGTFGEDGTGYGGTVEGEYATDEEVAEAMENFSFFDD
jgi:hypothetical protein